MDLDAARDFVRDNHRAVLTTRRANGDPQLSPVVCGVDAQGRVAVSTRETALKVKNLRRDPRASLCVLNDGSKDGTLGVLRGLAEANPEIVVIDKKNKRHQLNLTLAITSWGIF